MGRTDDMMIINGVNVFPSQIEEVIMKIHEVGTNYLIQVEKDGAIDKPGNLNKLTTALAEKNINIIDAYGFVLQPHKVGVCCLEIENIQDVPAKKIVEDAGFTVLEDEELYNL